MKLLKTLAGAIALTAAATLSSPPAHADVGLSMGNYDLLTNRYTQSSWYWFVSACVPEVADNCRRISGTARKKYYDEYETRAYIADGKWSFTVDVADGVRCLGYNLPSRDTYAWDAVTLAGTIESVYDVGCNNGPPGTQFWTFALQRL